MSESYLVILQVPTLDLLVFSTGEQVGAAAADRHATHCADVSRQRELQFPTGQIPDLCEQTTFSYNAANNLSDVCSLDGADFHKGSRDHSQIQIYAQTKEPSCFSILFLILIFSFTNLYGSVSRSCDKPLISRLHSDGPHPAQVTADDLTDS